MNVRIAAGTYKGRVLTTPSGHRTHPMSEKLRSALFNTLGDIEGLSVLDAFAGSGALGFEAVSRGAQRATLLENDRKAQRAIEDNISLLGLQHKARLTKAPVFSWSENNPELVYDIVLADPPFDDLQLNTLHQLPKHLKEGGVLVLNIPANQPAVTFETLHLVRQKQHGAAQLLFYKLA